MRSLAPLTAALFLPVFISAQVVNEPPVKEIKASKAEVTCIAVSPKGDKILVGLDHGAELFDIESGKKLYTFPFSEDENSVVYHCAFNDNGEYVVLIGFTGKRQVYDVKTGKKESDLYDHKWIPDPRATKAMGLQPSNSAFDRFYQQTSAEHNGMKATAREKGAVSFTDVSGKELQRLDFPENKDMHHLAPCVFSGEWFITGTDNGRVLFYTVR
jgi:WD40 repeat protein